ncbi:MAG TPA: hypothetical protein VMF59_02010 [Bacteroidota bacterium]|nr:hypothetical protein [Bacteroidota bacterium]
MHRNCGRILRCGIAAAAILSCLASLAPAQYLEQTRSYTPMDARFASIGMFARDFRPKGTNTAPDSLTVSYTRVMPLIGFRQGPVDFLFGYTPYDLHGASRSAIFFGVTFTGDYVIAGNRDQALVLPFLVDADFTKSESAGELHDNFDVGSVGIGTGIKYRINGESLDFSAMAAAIIHYSFDGYSLQTGSSPAAVAEVIALLPRVGILNGLALGYRFRFQAWTLGNGRYDYRTVNNGVFLGVLF